jgi:hypothetical protein
MPENTASASAPRPDRADHSGMPAGLVRPSPPGAGAS